MPLSVQAINALRQARSKAIADARSLLDRAHGENRSLTDEEQTQYDQHWADQTRLLTQITEEERLAEVERELGATADPLDNPDPALPRRAGGDNNGEQRMFAWDTDAYRSAFTNFVAGRRPTMDEERALSAGTDTEGGYTYATEQFMARLIKFIDDMVHIRSRATVIPVTESDSLGVPSLDADPADSDWTTELLTGSEDSQMAFGKRTMTPNPVAKRLKISKKLLRVSALNIEQLVAQRLAYKFAVTEEKGFLTGNGTGQPLGVFIASANGISTGRDKSSGSATGFTVDALTAAKYSLKAGYWQNAEWMFHRDGVSKIAQLRSDSGAGAGTGPYLWRESVRAGEPDRLLGRPVMMSEFAPNTYTTGLYVGMLADWSHYWIADNLRLELQVLRELYAETNQIGYIGRLEADGAPVLEEAFVRLKTD